MAARTRRQLQAEATREAMVVAARELFAERGYAATSIEDITARVQAARGALYHHFESKEALLRAVVERVEAEIMGAMFQASAADGRSAWERMVASCDAFLDACSDPRVQRIFLVEGQWLEPDPEGTRRLHALAEQALRDLFRDEPGNGIDGGPVSYAILGVLSGLARYVADADDPPEARVRAGHTLRQLLAGLRGAGP